MFMDLMQLIENRTLNNKNMEIYIQKSSDLYLSFFKSPYSYNEKEALEELGIDSGLLHQLLEDFTFQIIASNITLHKQINLLKKEKLYAQELDFTPFRNTIHKNLGVARNLRIKDSIEILNTLMIEDDLEKIEMLLEVLEASALKLKPQKAYETLQLIQKVT